MQSRGNIAIEQVGAIKIEREQPLGTRFVGPYRPRWDWETVRSYISGTTQLVIFKIRRLRRNFRTVRNNIG